ncbi:MAG: TrmJ/YjtD family RNA methyltransferase, partial [Gammaproteobacteria bacterium]|nr:TrmJ/YjtD family RNA methyltransferase [Gammaproteobacteria bacterium]
MNALDYIRVVLLEPTHPGNIGAAARAMANMGLRHLALVNPREFPSAQATARAAGADAILENAAVAAQLDHAIADCQLVVGASARLRSIEWPLLPPAAAMRKVAAAAASGARAALLFGRESRGLTNRELDRCHYLVRIPANPDFSSLNLAAAVMVLCYELRQAAMGLEGEGGRGG